MGDQRRGPMATTVTTSSMGSEEVRLGREGHGEDPVMEAQVEAWLLLADTTVRAGFSSQTEALLHEGKIQEVATQGFLPQMHARAYGQGRHLSSVFAQPERSGHPCRYTSAGCGRSIYRRI